MALLGSVGLMVKSNHVACNDGCSAPMPPKAIDARTGEPFWVDVPQEKLGDPMISVCFAPGTTPDQMQDSIELLRRRLRGIKSSLDSSMNTQGTGGTGGTIKKGGPTGGLKRDNFFLSQFTWSPNLGTPTTLRWSFIPDGVLADGLPSSLFATMDAKFNAIGGRAKWIGLFDQIYGRWSEVSGLHYSRIVVANDADDGGDWSLFGEDGKRGDLRVSMTTIDGQWNVLAYNYFPHPSFGEAGNMVIDKDEDWGGFSASEFRFLRNTLSHEHGHGLGIEHVCPINETKLMEPFLSTQFDGPQHDDIRAMHTLYGDFFEPNDTSAAATNLGSFAVPSTNQGLSNLPNPVSGNSDPNASRMSIEHGSVSDFYKFTIAAPAKVTVSLAPAGLTYLNGPQNVNPCSAGTNFNSLTIANLKFTVLNTNGTTVMLDVNATGAGQAETGTVDLPTAGTYFVQVASTNAHTEAQMYRLGLDFAPLRVVSGKVTLNGLSANAIPGKVVTVQVRTKGTTTVLETFQVPLAAQGAFSFAPTIAAGTYDIAFKTPGWLRKKMTNVNLSGTAVTLNPALLNGDPDDDNRVTTTDFTIVNKAFGATSASANWDARADLTGDGSVNTSDLNIVTNNQRLRGDD